MKVGILTFHNAHNWGAVLQAYSLRTIIRNFGFDAEIINYRNDAIQNHYPKILDNVSKTVQNKWDVQFEKFEKFINTVLLENNTKIVLCEDIPSMKYDYLIVGSDQVWEACLTGGVDSVYFLDFITEAKKISYAASKYKAIIEENNCDFFLEKLADFKNVSVREKELAKVLNNGGIPAVAVVDPTLLVTCEEYEKLFDNELNYEKYTLVYFSSENEELRKAAQKVATLTNTIVKEIHFFHDDSYDENQMADCGPLDFLKLFKNATYVITDSFHGVAFSIIFKRNFYALYGKDSRKDSLLSVLGLEQRHVTKVDDIELNDIDYVKVDYLCNLVRKESLDFLKQALDIKK